MLTAPYATETKAVLKRPQHWHASVYIYASADADGSFQYSTLFKRIVANDVQMAVGRCLLVAKDFGPPLRDKWHVGEIEQCAAAACLEGLDG